MIQIIRQMIVRCPLSVYSNYFFDYLVKKLVLDKTDYSVNKVYHIDGYR